MPLFSYKFYMLFKFNSAKCVSYAKKYVKTRNPFYKVFDGSEECCNFVCQSVLSGCDRLGADSCKDWYYINEKNYSSSWCDCEEFLKYLLSKNACGPFGRVVNKSNLSAGDLVFFEKDRLENGIGIVTRIENENIFYISKFEDCEEKMFNECVFGKKIFIHILGVNK